MQRLAYSIAEATPILIAFGPAAAIAGLLTAWLVSVRKALAA